MPPKINISKRCHYLLAKRKVIINLFHLGMLFLSTQLTPVSILMWGSPPVVLMEELPFLDQFAAYHTTDELSSKLEPGLT
jgi:hypothetical protein